MPEGLREVIPLILGESLVSESRTNPVLVAVKTLTYDLFKQRLESGFLLLEFATVVSTGAAISIYIRRIPGDVYVDVWSETSTVWVTRRRHLGFRVPIFSGIFFGKDDILGNALQIVVSGTGTILVKDARLLLFPIGVSEEGKRIKIITRAYTVGAGETRTVTDTLALIRPGCINTLLARQIIKCPSTTRCDWIKLDDEDIGETVTAGSTFDRIWQVHSGFMPLITSKIEYQFVNTGATAQDVIVSYWSV